MTRLKVLEAQMEAERFIRLCRKALDVMNPTNLYQDPHMDIAAMKRASLDLTRALSAMRARPVTKLTTGA